SWNTALEKPAADTVTLYLPGGSASRRYSPSVFCVVVRSKPLARSVTITVAFVTTFPLASLIVTCKSPVAELCAPAIVASNPTRHTTESVFALIFMRSPLTIHPACRLERRSDAAAVLGRVRGNCVLPTG